jgi:hypothetical protein
MHCPIVILNFRGTNRKGVRRLPSMPLHLMNERSIGAAELRCCKPLGFFARFIALSAGSVAR